MSTIYILQSDSGALIASYNDEPAPHILDRDYAIYVRTTILDGMAAANCTLYRINVGKSIEVWNGINTRYNWTSVNAESSGGHTSLASPEEKPRTGTRSLR